MTTQHTPGRLTIRGGYSIYADDGKTPVADTCLTNSVPANDEANARRLVACWNACQNLGTDLLETFPLGMVSAALEQALRHMADQRDELLAALKLATSFEEGGKQKARAAIAKAEGAA